MVDITRYVDDVYGASRNGSFFTKDGEVERGDTMESIGEFITGLRTDVDNIHTSSTLSVAMLQLQAVLRETHVMGDVLYPHGAMRVLQLDISDRGTRAGTLYGDSMGITYSANQGNIDGWSDGLTGAARFHGTTIGHRVAQVARTPSSGQYNRLTQSENDAGTAFAVLETDSSNDLRMQNPVVAGDHQRFTRPDRSGYTPAVGDWVFISFYIDGSRTVEVLLSVRTAAGVWMSFNDLFFTVDPGVTPTPQSSFNLAEYHLQHASVGNTHTIFDRVFFIRHPYIRHQEFPQVFTDFTGTAPDSIGLGNRIVGQGAAVLEVTEGMKFANTTVIRNTADDADLNIAEELAKIGSGGAAEDFDEYNPYTANASITMPTPDDYNAIVKATTTTAEITVIIPAGGYGRRYSVINPAASGDINIRSAANATLVEFHPGDTGIIAVDSSGGITRITIPALHYDRDFTFSPGGAGADVSIPAADINEYNSIRFRGNMQLVNLPQIPPGFNRAFRVANITSRECILRSNPGGNESYWPPNTGGIVFTNGPGNQAVISDKLDLSSLATAGITTIAGLITALAARQPGTRAKTG